MANAQNGLVKSTAPLSVGLRLDIQLPEESNNVLTNIREVPPLGDGRRIAAPKATSLGRVMSSTFAKRHHEFDVIQEDLAGLELRSPACDEF